MTLNLAPLKLAAVAPLTNSAVALYTVPASGVLGVVVKKATVGNITGSFAAFTLWIVPNGGSAVNGNILCPAISLGGNVTYIVNELNGLVLNPSDAIWGMASANTTMNFNASGFSF